MGPGAAGILSGRPECEACTALGCPAPRRSPRGRGSGARAGRTCLMASLRRVKVLLVLNLIAVAGFVLFLAKCRPIAVRSGEAFHEIRPRAEAANLSAHSASPIQDAVLKRLSLLEDIVYRQLNGKDARQCPWGSARAGWAPGKLRQLCAPCRGAGTSLLPRACSYSPCPVLARRPGLLERTTCFFSVPQL